MLRSVLFERMTFARRDMRSISSIGKKLTIHYVLRCFQHPITAIATVIRLP
jgi:hypothetical protein